MLKGQVESIYIAPEKGKPMQAADSVLVEAGSGICGDRYQQQAGTFSSKKGPDREITLIEMEAIEAVQRDYQIPMQPGDTRRNLVTRGVALNHLVGQEFQVGAVRLRGLRLCEPCGYLEKITYPKVLESLRHRGGLRAQVLQGGSISVGDPVSSPPGA